MRRNLDTRDTSLIGGGEKGIIKFFRKETQSIYMYKPNSTYSKIVHAHVEVEIHSVLMQHVAIQPMCMSLYGFFKL